MSTTPLLLIRHGESTWNQENKFTGWVDVDLSQKGVQEAKQAGQLLRAEGLSFDEAHTSVLKRAIKTLWFALEEIDQVWCPVSKNWRLNERHYGALQGLDKKATAEKYGEEQVFIWRRSYNTPPPEMNSADPLHPSKDFRYQSLSPQDLPSGESLELCSKRVLPYWHNVLAPQIEAGKKLLVVAHGNSLRALMKHLENISEKDICELNVPTGLPYRYEFDKAMKVVSKGYLGDAKSAQMRAAEVANQAKSKQ